MSLSSEKGEGTREMEYGRWEIIKIETGDWEMGEGGWEKEDGIWE